MIRRLDAPIHPKFQCLSERTSGRYEGLLSFAMKLGGVFGSALKHWSVLDVGGADGWLGEMLVCRRYTWIDPKALGPGAIIGMAEALPFADLGFDLVVSKQTLPHFTDPVRACEEMVRVAQLGLVIRQEFPESPIGWPGHSKVQIDSPADILDVLTCFPWTFTYDGTDFIGRLT